MKNDRLHNTDYRLNKKRKIDKKRIKRINKNNK